MELWLSCWVGFHSATFDYKWLEYFNNGGRPMLGEIRIEKQEVNGEWKLVIRSKYAADDSKETRASKLKKDLDFIENKDPNSRIRAVSHTGEVLETR